MRACQICVLVLLVVLMLPCVGQAIPQMMNYQGHLSDGSDNPITTTTTVEFRIWDAASGGNELWMESQSVTPDADGLFSVMLGSSVPIPDSALAPAEAYLGVKVDADPELSPRNRLVAVSYAYRIGTVDGASGGHITSKVAIGEGTTNAGFEAFAVGFGNAADGFESSVSGGFQNRASGGASTVGGGQYNTASGSQSTVGGGSRDTASGTVSTVAGGMFNTASAYASAVSGGWYNSATKDYSTVGGGYADTASGTGSTVSGGRNNSASADSSTVSGGSRNSAAGVGSAVGGGVSDTASGDLSTVAGGSSNTASGGASTVAGGTFNTAGGSRSSVAGGSSNTASNGHSTVAGGQANTASGLWSTVAGGFGNTASGLGSFAAGYQAKSLHDGAFVWGDKTEAEIASDSVNQFIARATKGFRFYTNDALTAGVKLNAGASAWAAVSDSTMKRNIREVDYGDILEKVSRLPISRWSYKAQNESVEHIGPMAQDVHRLFDVGDDDKTISTIDPDGISLAAIKALIAENHILLAQMKEQQAQISAQRDQLTSQQKQLAAQQSQMDELKELVTRLASESGHGVSTYGMK